MLEGTCPTKNLEVIIMTILQPPKSLKQTPSLMLTCLDVLDFQVQYKAIFVLYCMSIVTVYIQLSFQTVSEGTKGTKAGVSPLPTYF